MLATGMTGLGPAVDRLRVSTQAHRSAAIRSCLWPFILFFISFRGGSCGHSLQEPGMRCDHTSAPKQASEDVLQLVASMDSATPTIYCLTTAFRHDRLTLANEPLCNSAVSSLASLAAHLPDKSVSRFNLAASLGPIFAATHFPSIHWVLSLDANAFTLWAHPAAIGCAAGQPNLLSFPGIKLR